MTTMRPEPPPPHLIRRALTRSLKANPHLAGGVILVYLFTSIPPGGRTAAVVFVVAVTAAVGIALLLIGARNRS